MLRVSWAGGVHDDMVFDWLFSCFELQGALAVEMPASGARPLTSSIHLLLRQVSSLDELHAAISSSGTIRTTRSLI